MLMFRSIWGGLFLAAAIVSPVQAATLISHYEFNGDNLNAVGGAPDATRLGGGSSTYVTGFDGTASGAVFIDAGSDDDVLNATTSGLPNSASGLTSGSVAFWVRAGSKPNPQNVMGTLNDGATTGLQFQLSKDSGEGQIKFLLRDEDGDTYVRTSPLGALWDNDEWHHFAVTWDASSGTEVSSSTYFDGVLVDSWSETSSVDNFAAYDYPMYIGSMNNRGSTEARFRNGTIDDLRVYSGELTAGEVASLVPEPGSIILLVTGAGLAYCCSRKRSEK